MSVSQEESPSLQGGEDVNKQPVSEPRNYVAKNARAFNKSATFEDRKKALKKGKVKHKGQSSYQDVTAAVAA